MNRRRLDSSRLSGHSLRRFRFGWETLEQRLILDIGGASSLPPTIVVGRTLSAYDVPDVKNNHETITLTVYNQQAKPITGVLLTDTLAAGVTFATASNTASQLPDQSGQNLAWSLGTIPGFDRASVTLTVSLTSPTPLTLDTGAAAFGTLEAGMVSWTATPATLRSTAIAANLLASTPDANTTDPFVQEEAAELNYDPSKIFHFLQTDIGYNSYTGSLRGARGTLWSSAGNSLDDASLGVALMRASGIPAQYEEGSLSAAQAQQLILSMFPASYQTVGYMPPGKQTADPANDPRLLAETKDHFWFQFDVGSAMQDADPLIEGATIGQTFTTSKGTFTDVADNLRAKTEVKVTAEIYNQGFLGLGGGFSDTVVLDQTFNDVELVGRSLSIGNFVSTSSNGALIFSSTTYTYSPYIIINQGNGDTAHAEVLRGSDYQEVLTNFPLGSQVLTGVFVDVTTLTPTVDGHVESDQVQETLFDRIGYAARQGGSSTSVSIDPTAGPSLNPENIVTLLFSPGVQSSAEITPIGSEINATKSAIGALTATSQLDFTSIGVLSRFVDPIISDMTTLTGDAYLLESDVLGQEFQQVALVRSYYSSPRIVAISNQLIIDPHSGSGTDRAEIDILKDTPRSYAYPGQSESVARAFGFVHGTLISAIESAVLASTPDSGDKVVSSIGLFHAAVQGGASVIFIDKSRLGLISALGISAQAAARITAAAEAGLWVLMPSSAVNVGNGPTIAWIEVNPTTGDSIYVSESGAHQTVAEYVAKFAAAIAVLRAATLNAYNNGMLQAIERAQIIEDKLLSEGFAAAGSQKLRFETAVRLKSALGDYANVPKEFTSGFLDQARKIIKFLGDKSEFGFDPPIGDLLYSFQPPQINNAEAVIPLTSSAATGLTVSATPKALMTDQNTSVTFQANVQTSFTDTYILTAQAPPGWTVSIDNTAKVTATPARGLQGGTFPIQLVAQSTTNPDLVAQTTVNVTITPTVQGINFTLTPDPLFSVPFNGAQVPTAFRATIHNNGPTADTFNLKFSNLPSAFTLLNSGPTVTIPAGQTGIVGIYLQPSGSMLPAPGTNASFTVTATSTTNPAITQTQTENFTVPAIDAVTLSGNPPSLNTTPGTPVSTTITLQNVGNVPENVTLAATGPSGLTASGLNGVTLAVGQSATETITLTPDATTPLNSMLSATITASFGPSGAPVTQTLTLPVNVVVPGAAAIAIASVTAGQLGNTNLANRLNDLSTALTNLVQTPTSAVFKSESLADIDAISGLLAGDPFQSSANPALTTARAALAAAGTASAVQAAVVQLGDALTTLNAVLADEAAHGFMLGLSSNNAVALPNSPSDFSLGLQNNGSQTTTYDLSVTGLPANVTAVFLQNGSPITNVTVQPGQLLVGGANPNGVTLELTETGGSLFPTGFTVTATAEGAAEITQSAQGTLNVRPTFIAVTQVNASPAFTNPGTPVDIVAQVLNSVNQQQQALASYTLTDANGKVVFTSTPVSLTLTVQTSLATVDLGSFPTTGLALGEYTINVTVTDTSGKPIPGGTGQGSVLIGTPVTASLSVSPTALPAGNGTVTNTLTINPSSAGGGGFSLLGQVPDTGTAQAVAVNGTLAYVATTQGIDIVDVSDPTHPKVVGTFGQSDVGASSQEFVKIVGNQLIVAAQFSFNGSAFPFFVYSLTNPLSPQRVSRTTTTPAYLSGMDVGGNVAFFSTYGGNFLISGQLVGQFGNFAAMDFSNPQSPALSSPLSSNDVASPPISQTNESDTAVVNSQVAYVASSTSTGGGPTTGMGRLLVVNTQNPANLQEVRLPDGQAGGSPELDVPGTVYLRGIAIEGNHALVVGQSQGLDSGGHPLGNLTLTVLDITDPLNPQVITTAVTQNTFAPDVVLLKAQDLGNNLFAVTGTLANGKPALEIVDISDPSQPTFTTIPVPAPLNGLSAAGGKLYVTSSSGLSIFNIGQFSSTPVSASVDVPNGTGVSVVANSFNIVPTQIISGTNFNTLVWNTPLTAATNFTWQSTVSNLQPGEARAVTLGGSVAFTSHGTPGTLTLAPTIVSGAQILGLSPASQTVAPAASATYTVTVTNPTSAPDTFNLAVVGVPGGWVNLPASVTVPANSSSNVTLVLTSTAFAARQDYGFAVTAGDANGANAAVHGDLILAGQPPAVDPEAHGVVVSLTPAQASAGQGTASRFVVQLTNTGSADDTFSASVAGLPPGVAAVFSQNSVDVPPGEGNFRDLILTLTPAPGATVGSDPFTVTANSTSKPSIMGTTNGKLEVLGNGVGVTLNPPSGAPGSGFQLTVTNSGQVTDTFDLSLGGPAALVAALGADKVTLAPGASQAVPITTGAVNFALQGPLGLTGVASSESDAAVQASATAALTIPSTQGLTAGFNPATQSIPAPGPSTFLLQVNNTGNSEDSYTATITGTTGPITASLVGLDGQPTQAIPVFRLPGLATGALQLLTTGTALGAGTVTVNVTSLTTGRESATATATLDVGIGSLNATGVAVHGLELSPLTNIALATVPAPTGLDPSTQFAATIDWGDGATSAGSVSLAAGTYTVVGSHTYTDEHVFPVSVTIAGAGLSAAVTAQATIREEVLPDGTQGTANSRYVMEIYRDVLHRPAELAGFQYWNAKLDAGESHAQLAYEIVRLAFPEEEQRDEVQSLYETYLHRAAEPAGLQFWADFLFHGGSNEQLGEILVGSPEYLRTRGGGTNDGFLDALFHDALGRAVDAQARAFFDMAMAQGATPAAVAAAVFGTDEYRRELVSGLYQGFLDRPLDTPGVGHFVGELAAGTRDEQIIAEMVASDEFFAKTAE